MVLGGKSRVTVWRSLAAGVVGLSLLFQVCGLRCKFHVLWLEVCVCGFTCSASEQRPCGSL